MTRKLKAPPERRAYRFLLTYRQEVTEAVGTQSDWRCWVVSVTERVGRDSSYSWEPAQVWFRSLDEVPTAIRRLIETV